LFPGAKEFGIIKLVQGQANVEERKKERK